MGDSLESIELYTDIDPRLHEDILHLLSLVPPSSNLRSYYTIERFLISTNYDLERAKSKLISTIKWREERNIDRITETFIKLPFYLPLSKYWPSSYLPSDDKILFYERMGQVDTKSLLSSFPVDILVDYHIYTSECHGKTRIELENKYKKRIPLIIIQNASTLSLRHANKSSLSVMGKLNDVDELYYPLLLTTIYIVDPPSLFSGTWKMAKPFLSKDMLDIISVVSGEHLIEKYGKSVLPHELNGTYGVKISDGGIFNRELLFPELNTQKVQRNSYYDHRIAVEIRNGKNSDDSALPNGKITKNDGSSTSSDYFSFNSPKEDQYLLLNREE